MKKTKIFFALGSLVLASAALFAGKPHKKVYSYTGFVVGYFGLKITSFNNLTKTDNNNTLRVVIGWGSPVTVRTGSTTQSPLYFKW